MNKEESNANTNTSVVVDPVCHMKVDPEKAAHSFLYQDTTYYFCHPGCKEKFQKDPQHYLHGDNNDLPAATQTHNKPAEFIPVTISSSANASVFICPMDPEVRANNPGPCPVCGMALEREQMEIDVEEDNSELKDMSKRFWLALVLTVPVLVLSMSELLPFHFRQTWQEQLRLHSQWIQLLCATPVVAWCGLPFFQRGWMSIVNRRMNMFTLIATGTGVAYLYSLLTVIAQQAKPTNIPAVYFETAAVITTLVLVGQVMELKARAQTGQAIKSLLKLTPKVARQVSPTGEEQDISLDMVRVGDKLRVRPGERVPVDGIILEGTSNIDESLMTGEAVPVEKQAGDSAIAGTINGTGTFIMRATKVGRQTMLAQIVSLVNEAQRSKAPIQSLADKISAYFVPAVMIISLLTFIIWLIFAAQPALSQALSNAIAVLIIACPCALGLATPMSVKVAVGRGAKSGVLIKNAQIIELLEKIDTLVIDKTGTLTEGKPQLTSVVSVPASSELEVLQLAASLEQASEHPLALATVSGAQKQGIGLLKVNSFNAAVGKGIAGTIAAHAVVVGNAVYFQELGIDLSDLQESANEACATGQAVMFVASDGKALGFIAVADPIKKHATEAIKKLQNKKVNVIMLTGDNKITTTVVAKQIGIKQFESQLLPDQKAKIVAQLKAQGHIVAMAGDGINDAVALSAADVGIAMGTGADVAMESAGITLVKGNLQGIIKALTLSHHTMNNIKQNLFFAFVYNSFGILIAAGVLYPFTGICLNPMIAAAAMTFSSLSVITNSLRLRNVKL